MKRKVVLHGPSTLGISLPLGWVKKMRVKKGDSLVVEPHQNMLVVSLPQTQQKTEVMLGNRELLGRRYITAVYRKGYDEVSLRYTDPHYIEAIQTVVDEQTKGYELIQKNKTLCILVSTTGDSQETFDATLKKVWDFSLSMADACFEAVKQRDTETLAYMHIRDRQVNKLTNYCCRLLMKDNIQFKNSMLSYRFVRNLEEIMDDYQDLSVYCSNHSYTLTKEMHVLFRSLNACLREFHSLYYRFNDKKMEKMFKQLKTELRKIESMSTKKEHDTMIIHYLFSIAVRMRKLLSTVVELQL